MLEIEDIYSLLPEGTFSNIEAFKNYVETAGIESIYPAIPEGTFSSEEAFVKLYKKKKRSYGVHFGNWFFGFIRTS